MSNVLPHASNYEQALEAKGYHNADVYMIVGGYALHYRGRLVDVLTTYTHHVDDAVLRVLLRHIETIDKMKDTD